MYFGETEALRAGIIYHLENHCQDLFKSTLKEFSYLNPNKIDEITSFKVMDEDRYGIKKSEKIPPIKNADECYLNTFSMFCFMKCKIGEEEAFRVAVHIKGKGRVLGYLPHETMYATWYNRGPYRTYSTDEILELEIINIRAIDLSGGEPLYSGLDQNGEWDWHDSEYNAISFMLNSSPLSVLLRERYKIYKEDLLDYGERKASLYCGEFGGDELVAQGIYMGLKMAAPAFGEEGEAFLNEMLPDYSNADYAEDMINGILAQIKTPRKALIVKGIRDILEGNANDSAEVKAVLLAEKITEVMEAVCSYKCDLKRDFLDTLSDIIRRMIKKDTTDIESLYDEALEEALEKEKVSFTKEQIKSIVSVNGDFDWDLDKEYCLVFAYEYYKENYEKIPNLDFRYLFPQYRDDKDRIVAYYVTSCPERDLELFIREMQREEYNNSSIDRRLKQRFCYELEENSEKIIVSKLKNLSYLNQKKVNKLKDFKLDKILFTIRNVKGLMNSKYEAYKYLAEFKVYFEMKCIAEKESFFDEDETIRFFACAEGEYDFFRTPIKEDRIYHRTENDICSVDECVKFCFKNVRAIDLEEAKLKSLNYELEENSEWDWGSSEDDVILAMLSVSPLIEQIRFRDQIKDKYLYTNNMLKYGANNAATFSKELGGDELIARGIYVGLAIATPVFGEVGVEFLEQVVPNYSKADHAEDMIKGVLAQIKTPRKALIVKGIRDILEGNANDSAEVKAVLLAQKVNKVDVVISSNNYSNFLPIIFPYFLNEHIISLIKEGISDIEELYEKAWEISLENMDLSFDKQQLEVYEASKEDAQAKDCLMRAYEFYTENYEEIPDEDFKDLFPQYREDKGRIVAYYVSARWESDIKDIYRKADMYRKIKRKRI